MFSNLTIGLLVGAGVSAWVYNKTHERTGGNTQNALTVAAIVGVMSAIVVTTMLGLLF